MSILICVAVLMTLSVTLGCVSVTAFASMFNVFSTVERRCYAFVFGYVELLTIFAVSALVGFDLLRMIVDNIYHYVG